MERVEARIHVNHEILCCCNERRRSCSDVSERTNRKLSAILFYLMKAVLLLMQEAFFLLKIKSQSIHVQLTLLPVVSCSLNFICLRNATLIKLKHEPQVTSAMSCVSYFCIFWPDHSCAFVCTGNERRSLISVCIALYTKYTECTSS